MDHLVALVLFPSCSWNILSSYYCMNHLASVVCVVLTREYFGNHQPVDILQSIVFIDLGER